MEQQDIESLFLRLRALPDGTPADAADARAMLDAVRRFPAFTAGAVELLRHLPADMEAEAPALKAVVALGALSTDALMYASRGKAWSDFYPEAEGTAAPQTDDVIDVFLRTYGSTSPEEDAQLERLIFNPAPDYAELLARQEQEELPTPADTPADADDQMARINAFITTHHPARADEPEPAPKRRPRNEPRPAKAPAPADDSLLSESLAKLFIKQGRYERAFEIISSLSLKFPKKSAYFADQLRFLQKLIINRRHMESQNPSGDAKEK